jgi:hypothetical protein
MRRPRRQAFRRPSYGPAAQAARPLSCAARACHSPPSRRPDPLAPGRAEAEGTRDIPRGAAASRCWGRERSANAAGSATASQQPAAGCRGNPPARSARGCVHVAATGWGARPSRRSGRPLQAPDASPPRPIAEPCPQSALSSYRARQRQRDYSEQQNPVCGPGAARSQRTRLEQCPRQDTRAGRGVGRAEQSPACHPAAAAAAAAAAPRRGMLA